MHEGHEGGVVPAVEGELELGVGRAGGQFAVLLRKQLVYEAAQTCAGQANAQQGKQANRKANKRRNAPVLTVSSPPRTLPKV